MSYGRELIIDELKKRSIINVKKSKYKFHIKIKMESKR